MTYNKKLSLIHIVLNKKIFFWSPHLSHVGTINAVLNAAKVFKKFSNYDVYIIDNFGEFSKINTGKYNINFLKIFNLSNFLPKTGLLSKFFIYFFSLLSLPQFILLMRKYKPDCLIINLVGFAPLIVKNFFCKNCFVINSIQGYPRFNFTRKIIWKIFYNRSDLIVTMTDLSKQKLIKEAGILEGKIIKINNPVINRSIRILAKEKICNEYEKIFADKYCIVSAGRLTRQKNFLSLLRVINKINKDKIRNIFLFILGEGELRKQLNSFIKKNNLSNVKLLGYKKNPFKYIARSSLYVSSSLWEDPGHSLIEAGFLNIPILTSNCMSGPKENFIHKKNAFVYDVHDENDFYLKLKEILNMNGVNNDLLVNAKKLSKTYSYLSYFNSISKYI